MMTGKAGLNTLDHPDKNEALRINASQRDSNSQLTKASKPFRLRSPARFRWMGWLPTLRS